MAVLIGALVSRAPTYDASNGALQLRSAYGIHTLVLGTRSFVYVTGNEDDGLSAFEMQADGSLTNIQNIDDGTLSGLMLTGATAISSAIVGGVTYLYVASSVNHRSGNINVFRVESDGTLTFMEALVDTDETMLEGIEGRMAVAIVDGATFLVGTGDDDNGFSVFRINDDGTLTGTFNVRDAGAFELDNAMDAVTAQVGTRTFVFVAGEDDNGLSVFQLHGDGTVTNTDNVADNDVLNLSGAMGLATALIDGTTYLIASGGYPGGPDDGLSVFSVSGAGELTNVCNVSDSAARGLDGAQGLTTFTLDGETFVAVSGRDDGALSVFHLDAGGVLSDVSVIFDDGGLALDGTYYNAFCTVGGNSFLIATSHDESGVTVFELGSGNDVLQGTGSADLLLGLAGNDTLDGGGGPDRMIGGSGQDTYLLDDTGDVVRENAGEGADTVRASISYTLGAHVEHLVLEGSADLDGTGNGLGNRITGNGGVNHLQGGGGDDTLDGGAGQDEAVFSGNAADYEITQNGDGSVTVEDLRNGSPDGTDRLLAIERLRFADKVLGPDGSLADNDPPTDIALRGGRVVENSAPGTVVGRLQATDPDVLDRLTFSLNDPSGNFVVAGSEIRVASGARLDFEGRRSYAVTVTVDDGVGHSYQEDFVLSVTNQATVIRGDARDNRLTGTAEAERILGAGGDDVLRGLAGQDRLEGGAGRDRLAGGEGNDILLGGRGRDRLVGEEGRDTFVFAARSDSGATRATRDAIQDFGRADRIDLSDIDARRGPGNQAFRLDRDDSFSAGEIRVHDSRAGLVVEMNMDGDARAEMSLLLRGFHGDLDRGDFVL